METYLTTKDGIRLKLTHREPITQEHEKQLRNMKFREVYNVPVISGFEILED